MGRTTISGLAGCAALAALPAVPLVAAEPGADESAGSEIVVEGYTEKQVRHFLWRAIDSNGRVISRRVDPICVGVDNAPEALVTALTARIEANLDSLGIPRGEPGCAVNSVVVFYRDAHRFVTWAGKYNRGLAFASMYSPEQRRLTKPVRPAYAWHYVPAETKPRVSQWGGSNPQIPGSQWDNGSRLELTEPTISALSFAVIDSDEIDGMTTEQVGDWLTMQMLVEFLPDSNDRIPPDSILNLFTRSGGNPDAPPELSRLDREILAQIYASRSNFSPSAVRSAIARAVTGELKEDGFLLASR